MANTDDTTGATAGKGKPTPKRKQQEALKKRPLVLDRKADVKARRERDRAKRAREYEAMQSGDERYLPPAHQGAPRKFARDYIDARTTVGEFMLPVALLALGAMFFAGQAPQVASIASLVVVLFMIAWIVETAIVVWRLRRASVKKFGEDKLPRGFRFYAVTRISQMRALRMPKPQVRRGEYPV